MVGGYIETRSLEREREGGSPWPLVNRKFQKKPIVGVYGHEDKESRVETRRGRGRPTHLVHRMTRKRLVVEVEE